MKVEGECHCGRVTFEAEVDPEQVIICHCTDCQTLSGSAYRTVAPAIGGSFKLLTGNPQIYVKIAENVAKRAQAFCSECGTPIYAAPEDEDSTFFGIRVGAIKQRDQLSPKKQYWSKSAQAWVQNIDNIPHAKLNCQCVI
jgi:hypothetical protein